VRLDKYLIFLITNLLFGCSHLEEFKMNIVNLHVETPVKVTFGIADGRFNKKVTREIKKIAGENEIIIELYDYETISYIDADIGRVRDLLVADENVLFLVPNPDYYIDYNKIILLNKIQNGVYLFLYKTNEMLFVLKTRNIEDQLVNPIYLGSISLDNFYKLPDGNYTSPSFTDYFEGQMGSESQYLFILSEYKGILKYL